MRVAQISYLLLRLIEDELISSCLSLQISLALFPMALLWTNVKTLFLFLFLCKLPAILGFNLDRPFHCSAINLYFGFTMIVSNISINA